MNSLRSLAPVINSPGSSVFDFPTQPRGISRVASQRTNVPASTETSSVTAPSSSGPAFIVISGGTGGNSICSAFSGTNACYVLPVSDDGGSSSEIIRVLGGPSIGDIRSRLIRLIPHAPDGSPLSAIGKLMSYRLPASCSEREARDQWRDIVEGRSALWRGIPNDRKETIRGFLVHFESEILKRAHKNFSFLNGSIGNYFLAAAQGFFRSLPSAIFLFSSITSSQANIVPVIVTNHTVTIAAELEDNSRLVGQCEISHPVRTTLNINITPAAADPEDGMDEPFSSSQPSNVMFEQREKGEYDVLDAKIHRLFYINAYGQEIHPSPNPDYILGLSTSDVLVYSCGSLWTSIIPCLALRGVGTSIARSRSLRAKVFLLNGKNDRETDGYSAVDYLMAIVRTFNARYHVEPYGMGNAHTSYPVSAYITHMVYLKDTAVYVDVQRVTAIGVKCVEVHGTDGSGLFEAESVRKAIEGILAEE